MRNMELCRVVPCRHCCLMSFWKWCFKRQKSQHNCNQHNNSTQGTKLRQYKVQFRQDRRREEGRCSKGAEDDTKVENGEVCKFCEEPESELCEGQQLCFSK